MGDVIMAAETGGRLGMPRSTCDLLAEFVDCDEQEDEAEGEGRNGCGDSCEGRHIYPMPSVVCMKETEPLCPVARGVTHASSSLRIAPGRESKGSNDGPDNC